jgi:hypothetical protein
MTARRLALVLASVSVAVFVPSGSALADEPHCDGGNAAWDAAVSFDGTDCFLNSAITQSGVVPVGHTLHIGPTGKITVPVGQTLTLDIEGDLVMDTGSQIVSAAANGGQVGGSTVVDASGSITLHGNGTTGALISANGSPVTGGCSGGKAGNVTLTAGVDITTEAGSQITANSKCPAGEIKLLAPNGVINVDGLVESRSTNTGTGAVQRPGGGPITIKAGCDFTVSDTGVVSSSGLDPGADLVHGEGGCDVTILGLVESTGHGHASPNSPTNHCYYQVAGFPSPPQTPVNPADDPQDPRTDKPPNSTACVEIWAGGTLTIDKTDGANGEVSADLSLGASKTSWIDLFAREDVNVIGGPVIGGGADDECNAGRAGDLFAVHANNGGNSPVAGQITVKSVEGNLMASGFAFEADANQNSSGNPAGGHMSLEAARDVTFTAARVCARGDFTPTGGFGIGGFVGTTATTPDMPGIKAWNGSFSWLVGVGDVRPTGTDPPPDPPTLPAADRGEIVFQDCTAGPANTLGSVFPNNGTPATTPTEMADACGGAPTLPSYVTLPTCACEDDPGDFCEKGSVQSVMDPNSGRFPGNQGPDVVVKTHMGESIQDAVDNVVDVQPDGYLIVGVVAKDNGLLGGSTNQEVEVNKVYDLPFALIACSVTLRDPDKQDGQAVGRIATTAASPQNIFVMDLHGSESEVAGWKVDGDGRYMRNVDVVGNAVGMWLNGNNNTMHNGAAEENSGVGILVQGNGNKVEDADSFANGDDGIRVTGNSNTLDGPDVGDRGKGNAGDGIQVTGNANVVKEADVFSNTLNGILVSGNTNQLLKNDVGDRTKGNGGDGIQVAGFGNTLTENRVFASGGDGIDVAGGTAASPNVLKKNVAGDRDKGNAGNGIALAGTGNNGSNPVELEENTAKANGLNGFLVTGSGHQLKKNTSGDSSASYTNGDCEYLVAAGNFNATGNKANGATIAGANGSPFPTTCQGTP